MPSDAVSRLNRARAPRARATAALAAAAAALVLVASGCRTGPTYEQVHPLRDNRHPGTRHMPDFDRDLLYLPNRLVDFPEMFRFGLSIGPGAGIDIRFTRWVQLGLMGYWDAGIAWEGRRRAAYRLGGHWRAAAGPLYAESDNRDRWCRPDWEFSIEVNAFGGVRVAIDFAEMLDLFLGFFGVDILHDDFDYQ